MRAFSRFSIWGRILLCLKALLVAPSKSLMASSTFLGALGGGQSDGSYSLGLYSPSSGFLGLNLTNLSRIERQSQSKSIGFVSSCGSATS